MASWKIVEERRGVRTVVGHEISVARAVRTTVAIAKSNGFVPKYMTERELSSLLRRDHGYYDGDVQIQLISEG